MQIYCNASGNASTITTTQKLPAFTQIYVSLEQIFGKWLSLQENCPFLGGLKDENRDEVLGMCAA